MKFSLPVIKHLTLVRHAKRGRGDATKGSLNVIYVPGLRCDYLTFDPKNDVRTPLGDHGRPSQTAQAHQNQVLGVFFLDHNIFRLGQMSIPSHHCSIPRYISDSIEASAEIQIIASQFFSTVHVYLPIISKKIFYGLLNPLLRQRADVAFLCICMKMIAWSPSPHDDEPQTADYLAAKQYGSELENAGVFTVAILQGRLLITTYELGHGIYPAAYMSIRACIDHAVALGLDANVMEEGGTNLTWVEQEERRRIWWAIVILERYWHLTIP
ncbi:Transcription factor [Hyphodiscus hymeniophilus]|uniref:Transcription factor n=1 Tax=Hyphodiscus hymeniophilus TaxID=353542 RepID=A0A9P7AYB0_9HELO|nr:Transcription factor [Hyphodiscus hymeniophilus]